MRETKACVVLVLSCDHYRDLWPAVTMLFNRYWPDCPWPKYLASDTAPPLNALATVQEYIEIAENVGRRAGIVPRHHEHLPTLLGGAVEAFKARWIALFAATLWAAVRFGGGRGAVFVARTQWNKRFTRART
jgi:hypothetical protein